MFKFRLVVFFAAVSFAASAAAVQPQNAATKLVAQMYKDFDWESKPNSIGRMTLDSSPRNILSKYYDKPLVDMIIKRRNCHYEMCGLDFSPMWNSMDPEGASVSVKDTVSPHVVIVNVTYFNGVAELTYSLRETPNGWRIKDMTVSGVSLMTILDQPDPVTIVDPLFTASYDQRVVHFETIKTELIRQSCKWAFDSKDKEYEPKEVALYSAYTSDTSKIYIAGIGDHIEIFFTKNGVCKESGFPIFSLNQKVTDENPLLSDKEVIGVFENYLTRFEKAFGSKIKFLKWLDEETSRMEISCKGQSKSICTITYQSLQPKLQNVLDIYRKK